jgi:neutral ceramidase
VITPPVGSIIGNSYGVSIATGVTSDLHAKAVVFESGGVKAAIVACDLISLHRPIVERSRALIAERTGVPPDRVILAATHCHGGPQTHPMFLEAVGGEARRLSEGFVERLPGLIAESVRLAEADLQPARILFGKGYEDALSYNRRFLMKDGSVSKSSPMSSNSVRSVGPIDPDVGVIYVEGPRGAPLVTIVNFAAHVGGGGRGRISANYAHRISQRHVGEC